MPAEWQVIEAMLSYGGGFVQQLARLYRQADAENQRRLRAAFPEYFQQYAEMAAHLPAKE